MNGGDHELELSLAWRHGSEFSLSARYVAPDSYEEWRPADAATVTLDPEVFARTEQNPVAYGEALGKLLLDATSIRDVFLKARAAAESGGRPLRLRLFVAPDARVLHSLRWELLPDPEAPDKPLLSDPNILFSRYLASLDWRPIPARPSGDLRALVVVANPSDLAQYRSLTPIKVADEVARAREALRRFH